MSTQLERSILPKVRALASMWVTVATVSGLFTLGCATATPVAMEPVNGCNPASATDYSRESQVEIRFGDAYGYAFVPNCITVSSDPVIRVPEQPNG